jgi:hypothetical protein
MSPLPFTGAVPGRRGAILLLLAGLSLGCWQENVAVIGPDNSPVLVLKTDTLSYRADGLDNVHQTLSWSWTNTGTRAEINHNSLVPHGITQLTIRDGAGTVVYDLNIQLIYQEVQHTDSGAAGTWTVDLAMYGTTGDLDFMILGKP